MKWQPSVAQKGLLLVLAPLVVSLFTIVMLFFLVEQSERAYDREKAAKQDLIKFDTDALQLANCIITFVKSVNDESEKTPLKLEDVQLELAGLRNKMARRSKDQVEIKKLLSLIDETAALADKVDRLRKIGLNRSSKQWRYLRPDCYKLAMSAISLAPQMLERHQTVVHSSSDKTFDDTMALENRIGFFFMLYAFACAGLSIALVLWFSRNIVSRLQLINKNAENIAVDRPLNPPIAGEDEIAQLDYVLHESAEVLSESRRKERAVIDLASEVVFSVDKRGRFVSVGLPSVKQWQYAPDELLAKPVVDLVSPDLRDGLKRVFDETFSSPLPRRADTVIVKKDKSLMDCALSLRHDEASETLVGVALDNTERKRIERMKQRFVSIVSHDLRTPLASVSSSLSLLSAGARGELDEASRSRIQKCEESIERLMALIQDLLDMERLESGKFPLDLGCVSAYDVCETAIESIADLARRKHISIDRNYADAALLADERRVTQVLINLLSNAVKFSPLNGKVDVSLLSEDRIVRITVSDQGPGIDKADQEKIFSRFEQAADADRKSGLKGTGLGLAIARALVDAHDGKIGVESAPGQGSRFWIELPAYLDEGGDDAQSR